MQRMGCGALCGWHSVWSGTLSRWRTESGSTWGFQWLLLHDHGRLVAAVVVSHDTDATTFRSLHATRRLAKVARAEKV